MRLKGLVHSSPVTGDAPVYVALDDLTVLLGANDASKTRTLVALHELLRSLRGSDEDEDAAPLSTPPFDATLFVELTDEEAVLASTAVLRDIDEGEEEPSAFGAIGDAELSAFDESWLDELGIRDAPFEDDAPDVWLRTVRRSAGLDDQRFDPLFAALSASRLVAVEGAERGWPLLQLALPAELARTEPLCGLLAELGLRVAGDSPVVVVLLGEMQWWPPKPMWVPKPRDAIEGELLSGIVEAVAATRAVDELIATEEAHDDAEAPGADEAPDAMQVLLIEDADDPLSVRVDPSFVAYCGIVQMVANEVLPTFVSSRYWVSVEPQLVSQWRESPIHVFMESRADARRFALSDAAEGFQLWLQLGLLEGIVAVRRLAAWLEGQMVSQRKITPFRPDWWTPVCDRLDALREQRQTRRGFEVNPYFRLAALDALELVSTHVWAGDVPTAAATDLLHRGLDVATLFGGRYCYFIDEPERHLHPSLARDAARWLERVMRERQSQCVLTTHSVPFLDLGEHGAYNYLWRGADGRVFSRQFPLDGLHAFGVIAEDMGFDRGELLTNVRQLLFVEGRSDQEVLEILVGVQLRRLGVAVIPMHGVGRLHRVVEAEALFRYTSAAIRVLVDNDIAPVVPELRADPEKLEAALRDKKNTELQAVAQLLRTAAKAERDARLEILSIPAPDMLFMLDEDVLAESYPTYPGHAAATAAWEDMRARTGQNIGLKRYCRDHYGIPDGLDVFTNTATVMKERGTTHSLGDLVAQLDDEQS